MTTSPTKAGAHTPGPWSVGGPTGKLNQIAINPFIGCAYGAGDEVAANAALIAAAPLMLEALREAADVLSELYAKYQLKIGPYASQAQRVNVLVGAAIAAATKGQA